MIDSRRGAKAQRKHILFSATLRHGEKRISLCSPCLCGEIQSDLPRRSSTTKLQGWGLSSSAV